MPKTEMIFTLLPAGIDRGSLLFSLFLSPRLYANGTLANYEAELGNWPTRLASFLPAVQFEGGPTLRAEVTSEPRPDVWTALLPPTTPVNGYAMPPHAGRTIRSFPVRPLHRFINALYAAVASDPTATEFPSLDAASPLGVFVNQVGPLPELVERVKSERELLAQLGRTNPLAVPYYHARRFYDRGNQAPVAHLGEAKPPALPFLTPPVDFDFHKAVAALGDHPSVLRWLGLVIDLRVTPPPPGSLNIPLPPISANGRVQLALPMFRGDAPTLTPIRPWTAYQLDADAFLPAPLDGSDVDRGLLRLGDDKRYEIMQVDVDAAALSTMSTATSLFRHVQQATLTKGDAPAKAALPVLRSGGFTIARVDRATSTKARFLAALGHESARDLTTVHAEDVLRGYRVDVQDENGNWFSLCRRNVKYAVPGVDKPLPLVEDEGYVKGSGGTSNPDGAATNELYVHEALFGWDGWSLVAARPGRTIAWQDKPDGTREQALMPARNKPLAPWSIEPEIHAAPGTLPRLRFGRSYRFRARAVDLAGNGWKLGDAPSDGAHVSAAHKYLRQEPVAGPTLVPRQVMTLGEHVENLVIRTKLPPPATALPGDLPDDLFNATTERHVVPPKTTQAMAEAHRKLDGLDLKAAYRISIKEKGTLQDTEIVDETTGALVPVAGLELVSIPGEVDPAEPTPALPLPLGTPLPRGTYVIHKNDRIALPYLPDPLARGATFVGFPGAGPLKVDFGGTKWPALRTFRITLASGPTGTDGGDGSTKDLTCFLPPGDMVKLRVSSSVTAEAFDTLAGWARMTDAGRTTHAQAAADGRHWMLSPWRELQLVHAVQRPVRAPQVTAIYDRERTKVIGQTWVPLGIRLEPDSHSTGEVSLDAEWDDIEDRLGEGRPVPEPRRGHVTDLRVGYDETVLEFGAPNKRIPGPLKHELGDTKHRRVRYRMTGTTRYREYFPTSVTSRKDLITLTGDLSVELDVLSTARPAPPRVLYVVPTFRWSTDDPNATSRTRVGRGLRVYLDRPWYSTGADERLAVIVTPPGLPPLLGSDALRKHISEWGADPVYASTGPNLDLAPEHLPNRASTVHDLTLAEDEATTVTACGFDVEWNDERQLWFCDVELAPGQSYSPYVRLALARLQEHSIANAHLSRIVRTEFAHLMADRTATIQVGADGMIDVTVIGLSATTKLGAQLPNAPKLPVPRPLPGRNGPLAVPAPITPPTLFPVFFENPDAGRGHSVRVQIERRDADAPGDLGWEADSDEVMLSSFSRLLAPEVFWRGSIQKRTPPGQAKRSEYRLVIRELELIETDRAVAATTPVYNPRGAAIGERLVYVDVFPLK